MKKIIILFCLSLLLCFNTCNIYAAEESGSASVQPLASYIFDSVSSIIGADTFGGNCAIYGDGCGSLNITLQKKSSSGTWSTYNNKSHTKYFLHTSVCAYSKSYILPAGTYRCKTTVKAALDSDPDTTETRIVYSPELTIY